MKAMTVGELVALLLTKDQSARVFLTDTDYGFVPITDAEEAAFIGDPGRERFDYHDGAEGPAFQAVILG